MMNWMLRNCARTLAVAGLLAMALGVTAQAQTPEGTVITNTATVTAVSYYLLGLPFFEEMLGSGAGGRVGSHRSREGLPRPAP